MLHGSTWQSCRASRSLWSQWLLSAMETTGMLLTAVYYIGDEEDGDDKMVVVFVVAVDDGMGHVLCSEGAVLGVLYALTHLILSMPLYRWENIGSREVRSFNPASDSGLGFRLRVWLRAYALNPTVPYFPQTGWNLCVSYLCRSLCCIPNPLPHCWPFLLMRLVTRSLLSLPLKTNSVSSVETAPAPGFPCMFLSVLPSPLLKPLSSLPHPACPVEAEVIIPLKPTAPPLTSSPSICLPLEFHSAQLPTHVLSLLTGLLTGTRTLSLALRLHRSQRLLGNCCSQVCSADGAHLAGIIPLPLAVGYMYYCCPHFAIKGKWNAWKLRASSSYTALMEAGGSS